MIDTLNSIIGHAYRYDLTAIPGIQGLDWEYILGLIFVLFIMKWIVKGIFTFLSGLAGIKL